MDPRLLSEAKRACFETYDVTFTMDHQAPQTLEAQTPAIDSSQAPRPGVNIVPLDEAEWQPLQPQAVVVVTIRQDDDRDSAQPVPDLEVRLARGKDGLLRAHLPANFDRLLADSVGRAIIASIQTDSAATCVCDLPASPFLMEDYDYDFAFPVFDPAGRTLCWFVHCGVMGVEDALPRATAPASDSLTWDNVRSVPDLAGTFVAVPRGLLHLQENIGSCLVPHTVAADLQPEKLLTQTDLDTEAALARSLEPGEIAKNWEGNFPDLRGFLGVVGLDPPHVYPHEFAFLVHARFHQVWLRYQGQGPPGRCACGTALEHTHYLTQERFYAAFVEWLALRLYLPLKEAAETLVLCKALGARALAYIPPELVCAVAKQLLPRHPPPPLAHKTSYPECDKGVEVASPRAPRDFANTVRGFLCKRAGGVDRAILAEDFALFHPDPARRQAALHGLRQAFLVQ